MKVRPKKEAKEKIENKVDRDQTKQLLHLFNTFDRVPGSCFYIAYLVSQACFAYSYL